MVESSDERSSKEGGTDVDVVVGDEKKSSLNRGTSLGQKGGHRWEQIFSAVLYMLVSILITFANKVVLTSYSLKSFTFLSFSQSLTAVIVIPIICKVYSIELPGKLWNSFKRLQPLPTIFVLNAAFSLGGTERLSIPMMTVLRRFSILLTMVFEWWILGVTSSYTVAFTVALMIIGAVIAALNDLAFSFSGYVFVSLSDIFTALNYVINKKKMEEETAVGMHGILLINNVFNLALMLIVCLANGELLQVMKMEQWFDPGFLVWFFLASVLGICLNFSVLYCTVVNSALTTCVVGCLKNLAVTYCGMVFVPGYAYTMWNFVGINISVFGSVLYSIVRR